MTTLRDNLNELGRRARAAARAIGAASGEARSAALEAMADGLREAAPTILAANAEDLREARLKHLPESFIDRLAFDAGRLDAMAAGVLAISLLPDQIGETIAEWTRPTGLRIARVRTPIGVIGMIFESRPNVAADAAALALRAGNAIILRGGSDSARTVAAIGEALQCALADAGLPEDTVQIVSSTSREAVGMMLEGLGGAIDVIVPRGGRSLVDRVRRDARVPVFAHLEGVNHTYVHVAADVEKAIDIVVNAKMRRVSVCGATEKLLIDREALELMLPPIARALEERGCELRGEPEAQRVWPMRPATSEDWSMEYLAPILAIRVVGDLEEAMALIDRYGSHHTDAIITEDQAAADRFLSGVDSAIVLHNASTQFADGGEFGFGGEIGIATGRLHARGPVGAEQLTTFKYVVRGTGQIRP